MKVQTSGCKQNSKLQYLFSPFLCVSGRCVRSFSVRVINSTCVSLWWTLLDNSVPPLFMVVQWSPQRQHDSDHHKVQSRDTWARLPYTDRPTYLRGNTMASFLQFPFFLTLKKKRFNMILGHGKGVGTLLSQREVILQ